MKNSYLTLQNLKIKNFRGLRDIEINFSGKSTVIFGSNGSGKTSFLDGIALLFSSSMMKAVGRGVCSSPPVFPHDFYSGTDQLAISGQFQFGEGEKTECCLGYSSLCGEDKIPWIWLLQKSERVQSEGASEIPEEDAPASQGADEQKTRQRLRELETKAEAVCGWLGQLLSAGRYENAVGRNGRMDAATYPDGVLGKVEAGANAVQEPPESGGQYKKRRNPRQHEKRLLANRQQPYPQCRFIQ